MSSLVKRLLLLLVAAGLGGAIYATWYVTTLVALDRLPTEFEIAHGMGLRGAIRRLTAAGVHIGNWQFELLVRALDRSQDIKAGSYELVGPVTPLDLLGKLTRGDVTQAEVKLIEGWTFRQFRLELDQSPYLRHEARGLDDTQLMARIGASETEPEGLFFPDTYLFAKGSADIAVLRRAYRAMQRHLAQEWTARDPTVPYRTPYEALIMASIIEKETGRPADRDLIGGVLVNRLRVGMRLQADPTVIYGLGASFDGNLTKASLQQDGPYNTYTRAGLPPTPIDMPSLASLRAALRPAKTDALYYVSRGDGSSEFSRTLNDHNRAVTKYLRLNRHGRD
ncbi:MAG: endolytic transglycosylase MltG [Burkholderiales bacterium]